MNNIKKIIPIYAFALVAVMFLGGLNAFASEVTGTLSSSNNSQPEGMIGGSVGGGSTVSGTLGGENNGSTISGTVSGGDNNISGNVSGGIGGGSASQANPGNTLAVIDPIASDVPGLPNTGIGPVSSITILASSILLYIGILIAFMVYNIFSLKRRKVL